MKQFIHRWDAIRERALRSSQVEALIERLEPVLSAPAQVPETGIASWNLYYFCPDHGVRLVWDRHSPTQHRCPIDDVLFSGEPYDSAWWREMNGRNARMCYQSGLLWRLTGEHRYMQRTAEILSRYADYYPGYQVHGNIPHNGPGKMNAQTLCEANCLLDMALGYDFIADALSPTEQQHICQQLLREAATFLMAHRSPQMHNHEVKISAAIAVIGFILEDDALIDFAVNQPYGLRWQLEHGLLKEGLWFEGSIHYHYYALQGFIAFEKLAHDTRWSLQHLPYYRQMLDFPLTLLMPDGTFPRLNDCIAGQETLHHRDIYEFAWFLYHAPRYAQVLNFLGEETQDMDTVLWRDTALPDLCEPLIPERSIYAPGAGISLWRKPQNGQAVLIKHSPYGGEHDHYDRLSVLIWDKHFPLLPDLGTTGYGAKMHYAYYKNSATHNTLSVNQTNQPPATPQISGWHQGEDYFWLDSHVDWRQPAPQLNSHTRVEWDSDAWKDIQFRRRILWVGNTLVDLSTVENPHQQQLDWALHLDAQAIDPQGQSATFATTGPLSILRNSKVLPLVGFQRCLFAHRKGEVALWLAGDGERWQGNAPGNPAISDLSYVILRSRQKNAQFVAVWDFDTTRPITELKLRQDEEGWYLTCWRGETVSQFMLPASAGRDPALE
ncbi:heparinase II/III domain-containing protein [Pseudocitrobacter cyperus]|uniref:Heparinase II/III family protein n=1 Tax=Pseudocitrobacter cyperus TaxID=3112843 RepID=A0ABV0HIH6_9ENTR